MAKQIGYNIISYSKVASIYALFNKNKTLWRERTDRNEYFKINLKKDDMISSVTLMCLVQNENWYLQLNNVVSATDVSKRYHQDIWSFISFISIYWTYKCYIEMKQRNINICIDPEMLVFYDTVKSAVYQRLQRQ